MKLATFAHDGTTSAGVIAENRIHAIPGVTVLSLVERGLPAALEAGEQAIRTSEPLALGEVKLLPPLSPPSMRDFVAFEEHVEGVVRAINGTDIVVPEWYDAPTFYFTNPHTLLGHGDPVEFPSASNVRDFELEVAVVVSGAGRSLSVEQARNHVFGYTILNDWSARDLQSREMKVSLGPAKGKDFANSLGPCLVTADELERFRDDAGFLDLWCSAEVNGVEVGNDLLSNMGWTFESMIAYASRDAAVDSGDVLGSGTTGHGGCLAELWGRRGEQDPPPLQEGDVVTLTVEGIGSLTNVVATASPVPELPAVRRRSAADTRAQHLAQRATP
jgi:2-keto-4-pentenoate hydratase/2-oxohepta-3-ene-1,7-dioic acid hydratase in catechol pathway